MSLNEVYSVTIILQRQGQGLVRNSFNENWFQRGHKLFHSEPRTGVTKSTTIKENALKVYDSVLTDRRLKTLETAVAVDI